MSQTEPHDEFLELCAASTSGRLTEDEQRRLEQHLAVCPICREALRQYQAVVAYAIPELAAGHAANDKDRNSSWSLEQAEASLFERISQEQERQQRAKTRSDNHKYQVLPVAIDATWRNVWTLCVAAILLFVALGFSAYYVGLHRSAKITERDVPAPAIPSKIPLEEKLSDAAHDREVAQVAIRQRDKLIADLRRQLERQSADVEQMKAAQAELETALRNGQSVKQSLSQQKTELEMRLASTEANAQTLQQKLDSLAQQSLRDAGRAAALEARVHELTNSLHERDAAVDQSEELLAHDRDIRELMGARDLYIAEVYDVARTGATQKPYGRVFYTKGKSLIFYAYDLDQQASAKSVSTFQVWGRRGPDREQALPLGIFYEDNAAKKRWVLKLDDPKRLAQIDAVFVTIEPNGGSRKPSGAPLLFAYLHVDPNHP